MSERLFDALEIGLQALEKGESIDSVLGSFPAQAAQLRPLLEASLHARTLAGSQLPDGIQRRGRARLLQAAAKMREAKRAPRRTWLFNFRPVAVALMVAVFFLSSTGLVRASTGSLPGDNLYPVKRTWEDVRLIFATSAQEHNSLELTYETERLDEVQELLAQSRDEPVSFSGYVTAQVDGQWTIAGVPVVISETTQLPSEPIIIGAAVMVTGRTDPQGFLTAQSIVPLAPGAIVPTLDHDQDNENNEGNRSGQETESGSKSGNEASDSGDDFNLSRDSKLEGTVQSMDGKVWIINGQTVNVSGAEIVGVPVAGANVTVEGYINADGVFVATKAIFDSGGGSGDNSSSSGSDGSDGHSGSGGGGGDDPPAGEH
jgi:uncharacterized membrane protein YgcG